MAALYITTFLFSFRSLEPGQASFQAFGTAACSFPTRPVEFGAATTSTAPYEGELKRDPYTDFSKTLEPPPFGGNNCSATPPDLNGLDGSCAKDDSFGEATFLDFENINVNSERKQSTLDEIEQEVNKVRVALDEDSRALEEDERQQAEADNWSLNVSCDSGVYNRASSRDSGPHSGKLPSSIIPNKKNKCNWSVFNSYIYRVVCQMEMCAPTYLASAIKTNCSVS